MKQSRKHGFTLIELLVVVAIIALLIAILLPSLGKARESARRVACSATIRSVTMALKFYAEDNNQGQPLYACYASTYSPYDGNTDSMEFLYYVALSKYLGIPGVSDLPVKTGPGGRMWAYVGSVNKGGAARRSALFCRSDPSELNFPDFDPATSANAPSQNERAAYSSYGCVAMSWGDWNVSTYYVTTVPAFTRSSSYPLSYWPEVQKKFLGRVLSRRATPSTVPVFAHQRNRNSTYNAICSALGQPTSLGWTGYMYDAPVNIHGKIQPVSFYDGHVEVVARDVMVKLTNGPKNSDIVGTYKEGHFWSMLYN